MMKRWITLGIVWIVLAALGASAHALGDTAERQAGLLGLDELEDAGEAYLDDIDLKTGPSFEKGLAKILDTGSGAVPGILKKAVRSGVLLLVVILLCGVADGIYAGTKEGFFQLVPVVGALAITAVAVADANSLLGMGRQTIDSMETFSKILLPAMATATAMGGAPAGAAARQLATLLFSDILLTLINRLLIPMVYVYIATCTAYTAVGNEGLRRIAEGIKWAVTAALTGVVLVFVTYLTVSGAVAGTADAMTVKAAKLTMSGMVPVVGGILADAAETVLAGANFLRNSIGIVGMLVVLGMCIVPFLHLGMHYITYKCASILAATVSENRMAELIDGIGGAFGLILAMAGSAALLLLVSMISAISMVAP